MKKHIPYYLFIASFLVLWASIVSINSCVAGEDAEYTKKYNFSKDKDWFTDRVPVWNKVLADFRGKPNIRYLEIGVFEGRSAIWMLENILTHPTARLTCVDIFWGPYKKIFLDNLTLSGFAYKAKIIQGRSQDKLRRLPPNSFDIIYIDGSHIAYDVLADAVLSWQLLKNGGLLIFDDYGVGHGPIPSEYAPRVAVDAFITVYRNNVEIVHRGYQVILKKQKDDSYFSLGPYLYSWEEKQLYFAGTNKPVAISNIERELIERLFISRRFGEINFDLNNEITKDQNFIALKNRLKLDFREKKEQ